MNKKKIAGIVALLLVIGGLFTAWGIYANLKKAVPARRTAATAKKDSLPKFPDFDSEDSSAAYIDSVVVATDKPCPRCAGRKISICITGVDSRIGDKVVHADANHLVNVWLDSGIVEVVSIPRGTFCDAGFADTSGLNYLANLRANRGRKSYMKEISKISGIPKIDYYVEFGFSQAIGLLKLLGFRDNAGQMLRVLRSRKSFATGDYQRSFNQGQFVAQMICLLSKLDDNVWTDLVVREASPWWKRT